MGMKFGGFAMKGIWRFLNLADFNPQETDDATKWLLTARRRCFVGSDFHHDGCVLNMLHCLQYLCRYSYFSLLAIVLGTAKCLVALPGPFPAAYLPIFALSADV